MWQGNVGMWLLLPVLAAAAPAQDAAALRGQIEQVREKIAAVQSSRTHMEQKAIVDSAEYAAAVGEYARRAVQMAAERDSLAALVAGLVSRRDSLAGRASLYEARQTGTRGQEQQARQALRGSCRALNETLTPLAKCNIERIVESLRFLESELAAGTVVLSEGLARFGQIVGQIEQAAQRVESWTGPSPVAALRGEVTYLRMGFVWLACVGADDHAGYRYDAAADRWVALESGADIRDIRTAVAVATGKAAPQLVPLPFDHPVRILQKDGGQ